MLTKHTPATIASCLAAICLSSCTSPDSTNSGAHSPAGYINTATVESPASIDGRILVLNHDQSCGRCIGMDGNENINIDTMDISATPEPNQHSEHGRWPSVLIFKGNTCITTHGEEKTTYTYQKTSDKEARITSSYFPCPEEEYGNGTMRLRFTAPNEAQAIYLSGGVDDMYLFQNVRVSIK